MTRQTKPKYCCLSEDEDDDITGLSKKILWIIIADDFIISEKKSRFSSSSFPHQLGWWTWKNSEAGCIALRGAVAAEAWEHCTSVPTII